MSSQGTASDISRQEADDLLHKLITESTKVQAVFTGRGAVAAMVTGLVSRLGEGIILVTEGKFGTDPSFCFGTRDVSHFRYGDSRAFTGGSPLPPILRFTSALCFTYPDGASVVLFEFDKR
jgi:hypothetical protein